MKRLFFKSFKEKKNIFTQNFINFSKKDEIENFKETNLKGYINYIRKHSHKYALTDPLNLKFEKKTDKLNADFWELGQIEKLDEFPIDTSYTFNETLLKQETILDLENHLHSNYLKNVIIFKLKKY